MRYSKNFLACLVTAGFLAAAGLAGCSSAPMKEAAMPSAGVASTGDMALADAVMGSLRQTPGLDSKDLVVRARGGVVTLGGWAERVEDEDRARVVASRVPGVVKAVSQIRVWSTDKPFPVIAK